MAKIPVKGRINQAKARVEAAKKRLLVRTKPGAAPVPIPVSARRGSSSKSIWLGLPIKQMMRETTARTRELLNLTQVSVVSLRKTQSGFSITSKTITNKPQGSKNTLPNTYKQIVSNLDDSTDSFSNSKWIKVECQCDNFKYERDFALHEKFSSDLKHSIDEPPDVTNPEGSYRGRRRLGICKHLFAVCESINRRGM